MTGLLSPSHIVILLIVLLLVFGAKRLPELGRSLGAGMREFKHSIGGEPLDGQRTLAAVPELEATGTPATVEQPPAAVAPFPVPPPATIAKPIRAEAQSTPPTAA
jgi:sec-independent protein translocase protein TatA